MKLRYQKIRRKTLSESVEIIDYLGFLFFGFLLRNKIGSVDLIYATRRITKVIVLMDFFFFFLSIISVKAKSFADREIRYTLKAQSQGAAGTFNIGPTSGIVKLAKELDFEDVRQPHVYTLVVTATEDSGGFSTSVEVEDFIHLKFYVIEIIYSRSSVTRSKISVLEN